MENVWREDKIKPQDASREELLTLTKENNILLKTILCYVKRDGADDFITNIKPSNDWDIFIFKWLNNSTNSEIVKFNGTIKSLLPPGVKFIDIYGFIKDGLDSGKLGTNDGLHYKGQGL